MDLPRRNRKTFRHMRIPPADIVFGRPMSRKVLVVSSPYTPPRHGDVHDRAEDEEDDELEQPALHDNILRRWLSLSATLRAARSHTDPLSPAANLRQQDATVGIRADISQMPLGYSPPVVHCSRLAAWGLLRPWRQVQLGRPLPSRRLSHVVQVERHNPGGGCD